MSGRLVLVPTPLGNLGDITYRAVQELKNANLIACEDTRRTKKLLMHLKINKPIIRFDDHASFAANNNIKTSLSKNMVVCYCSDAGMPGINDPGFELIRLARQIKSEITVLPGPSVVLLALVASGLPTHSFSFFGYLPHKSEARKIILQQIATKDETVVVFETGHRIHQTLITMLNVFPKSKVALGRELTKMHETWYTGTPQEVIDQLGIENRGEMVLVISNTKDSDKYEDISLCEVSSHNNITLPSWALSYINSAINGGMPIRDVAKPLAKYLSIDSKMLYKIISQFKKHSD